MEHESKTTNVFMEVFIELHLCALRIKDYYRFVEQNPVSKRYNKVLPSVLGLLLSPPDMSSPAPAAPQKINLRRPDIMNDVQAQVVAHYRSELVERIRAAGGTLTLGNLTIRLAKEFGFCYGVERAIDLAYAARKAYPDREVFLLGEIIHNPEVNDQIQRLGIRTIASKPTEIGRAHV